MKQDKGPYFQLTDETGWFDLLRTGEFPNARKGADGQWEFVVQVVNDETLRNLVRAWQAEGRPELLIDRDHESEDEDGSTEAFGWGVDLRVVRGVLQPRARWTDIGANALSGGRFRYASAVIGCEDEADQPPGAGKSPGNPLRVRPVRLQSVGLTNRPNIPGLRPIANRAQSAGTNQQQPKPMNEIAKKLGLPETADEAAILEAIGKLQSAAKAGEDAATAAVDETMKEYANCIPAGREEFFRANLRTSRDATLDVLRGLKTAKTAQAAAGGGTLHNRAGTAPTAPADLKKGEDAAPEDPRETYRKQQDVIRAIRNRLPHLNADALLAEARREKPEVFARA